MSLKNYALYLVMKSEQLIFNKLYKLFSVFYEENKVCYFFSFYLYFEWIDSFLFDDVLSSLFPFVQVIVKRNPINRIVLPLISISSYLLLDKINFP